MTTPFPTDMPAFMGNNAPFHMEVDAENLIIEGEIPKELNGTFIRLGPDPQYPPREGQFQHLFNGDGVVSGFRIKDGDISFKLRHIRTERFLLEREAGEALFGEYRNKYTDDPRVAGKSRNAANTMPLWHHGKLLALKEDSLPFELNPLTYESIGEYDFNGQIKCPHVTAHPKIDPVTGELLFYGSAAKGECTPDIAYYVADKDGKITHEQWFEAPYSSMVHDFAVTENYVIFPIMPTTSNLDRIKAGGSIYAHEPDKSTYVGIMPRSGSAEDIRWFEGPSCFAFHVMNAYEEDGKVIVDLNKGQGQMFFPNIDGTPPDPSKVLTYLNRWTFDMNSEAKTFEDEVLVPEISEFPRLDERYSCRKYRHGFMGVVDLKKELYHSPAEIAFNSLAHVDVDNRTYEMYNLGMGGSCGEQIFVPRSVDAPEGDGYLLAVVFRAHTNLSEVIILDAKDICAGPIATVKMGTRLKNAFHVGWIPG